MRRAVGRPATITAMDARSGESAGEEPLEGSLSEGDAVEPRWPVALAVGAFIAITVALHFAVPHHPTIGPVWLVPSVELSMLVLLIVAHPARVAEHRRSLRRASLTLVMILAAAVFASTAALIKALVEGGTTTNSASALLASGSLTWFGNVLIFGLLYWLLDSGGPVARYRGEREYPDFAFSQQLNPELAPPGWRPLYVDYAILGLTTSTAFSPTDVMPMRPWAKLMMAGQSMVSLILIGLVIARAVNVFN
jgi:uncharacterized membrane protein